MIKEVMVCPDLQFLTERKDLQETAYQTGVLSLQRHNNVIRKIDEAAEELLSILRHKKPRILKNKCL